MKKNIILLFIIWLIFFGCNHDEFGKKSISIDFGNNNYDSVTLVIFFDNDNRESINGFSKNGCQWKFILPDSIIERAKSMYINIPSISDTIHHRIGLCAIIEGDTLKCMNYCFNQSDNIKLFATGSDTIYNMLSRNPQTHEAKYITWIIDDYIVRTDESKELLSSMEGFVLGYGHYHNESKENYEKFITKHVDMTNKYPESQYLISCLRAGLANFNSRKDVATIFSHFSEEKRQSYYGKKINKYINDTIFVNDILPECYTGKAEALITDSTKYNLIVFSASWCAPCHAMIPLLKEVHADLKEHLDITYVSTDETKTIEKWRELVVEKNIPWRSLLAEHEVLRINEKYAVQGIPHLILVHPYNMKMKIIDIRKEYDKNALYELFK